MLLVLVQIAYPLTSGVARDAVTVVVVLLSAATALVHAGVTRGLGYAAGFLVIVSGLGLVAEIVGTATGFPFGCYEYADGRLGPAVAGVPLVVALAWTGGLYPVWVVAGLLARRTSGRIVLTAVGAVGWDLFLDPQMVADGQWLWCDTDSGLPGLARIPATNYLGWFGVALLMALALTVWERVAREVVLSGSNIAVPIVVFLWTWLGSALAHAVFLDLPASACYGGIGLGLLGVPLVVRLRRSRGEHNDGGSARRVAI
ncbi:carotenoid biosynthesis protein [Nocardia sp. GCM10030253]|uniref:carotenoid biosynthesis protein n=1 Tax=Nocardia sp. GCM10030253 TaxID=3273404 RepID=UPI00363970F9